MLFWHSSLEQDGVRYAGQLSQYPLLSNSDVKLFEKFDVWRFIDIDDKIDTKVIIDSYVVFCQYKENNMSGIENFNTTERFEITWHDLYFTRFEIPDDFKKSDGTAKKHCIFSVFSQRVQEFLRVQEQGKIEYKTALDGGFNCVYNALAKHVFRGIMLPFPKSLTGYVCEAEDSGNVTNYAVFHHEEFRNGEYLAHRKPKTEGWHVEINEAEHVIGSVFGYRDDKFSAIGFFERKNTMHRIKMIILTPYRSAEHQDEASKQIRKLFSDIDGEICGTPEQTEGLTSITENSKYSLQWAYGIGSGLPSALLLPLDGCTFVFAHDRDDVVKLQGMNPRDLNGASVCPYSFQKWCASAAESIQKAETLTEAYKRLKQARTDMKEPDERDFVKVWQTLLGLMDPHDAPLAPIHRKKA